MKEKTSYLAMDSDEQRIIIGSLNDSKTRQMQEGRPSDPYDELILKVAYAPSKRVRVINRSESHYEVR